ncbi:hypothetical protein E3N88_17374 [Mikania micrantha]|uniref:Protein TIFY n=1 Tax=Mikania micrantha TaxID=192012 RepID=A0A5N6NUF6_9ASTR|nr:hypothetical protein E3N88_17374 [Mikania micrantha]
MSSSSEIVDSSSFSGQYTPEKTSFSQTCNVFSDRVPPTATMNLFPAVGITRATVQQPVQKQIDQSRTMTIFYNGQVITFDDLSPEKVKEILKLAEQGAALKPPKPDESSRNIVVSDLPIARKASIARFLEKRKDRITARSPYQAQDVSKQDDKKTWLGLGS